MVSFYAMDNSLYTGERKGRNMGWKKKGRVKRKIKEQDCLIMENIWIKLGGYKRGVKNKTKHVLM